jgi:hypothetical protein
MNRMKTRKSGPYLIWATMRYRLPLMSKTTRLLARKSAVPNAARTSRGPDHAARSTIENHSLRGPSASLCLVQNVTRVPRLKTRNLRCLPCSHRGSKPHVPLVRSGSLSPRRPTSSAVGLRSPGSRRLSGLSQRSCSTYVDDLSCRRFERHPGSRYSNRVTTSLAASRCHGHYTMVNIRLNDFEDGRVDCKHGEVSDECHAILGARQHPWRTGADARLPKRASGSP